MRLGKLVFAAFLVIGVSGLANAHDWRWQEGSNQEERSEAYHDGFRDGQRDRVHNRGYKIPSGGRWEDQAYREAYVRGYRAGYGFGRDGDNDRDDGIPYRRDGGAYPQPGYPSGYAPYPNGNYANQPYQMGYQDGYQQGLGDRNNGHSFRPTQHGYYSDGNHGYSSAWGSKDQYKAQYRQGYMSGYQRGYNGR